MKVRGYIIALAVAGLSLISCSKEAVRSEGGTAVAYIGLAADAGSSDTKSSINGLNVSWTAGDDIFYYTGRYTSGSSTALTDEGLYKVPEACDNLRLPVEYNDGDNRVTVLTKGRAVGTITPASLNSLTIADAVPASQDGTFASTYIAACEGNLLELTALTSGEPKNLTMTPVQAFVRFKLSSLTVGGQTVNRITVAGKSGGSAVPVCGDLGVSITENGSSTHTVSSAAGSNTGNLITIDKSGSKFNAGEYIYVALLPRQYDELTLTLYNGGTILATVPVKQGAESEIEYIDLGQGKMVDLSEINSHALISSTADKFKMFPEKVAITSERPTKYLWLKIEPDDFSGRVEWSSSDETIAIVTQTGETLDNVPGIGKCIRATVTNKKVITPLGSTSLDYNLETKVDGVYKDFPVTITATVYDPKDNTTVITAKTCKITVGDFLDLGTRTVDGQRCLWARHVLMTVNGGEGNGDISGGYLLYPQAENYVYYKYTGRIHFGWGEHEPKRSSVDGGTAGRSEPMIYVWGEETFANNLKYSKYNSDDNLPYLQRTAKEFSSYGITGTLDTVDDVAVLWNSACHMPMVSDVSALINNCDWDLANFTLTSRVPGYTDCTMTIVNWSTETGNASFSKGYYHYGEHHNIFWTAEYDHGYSMNALQAWFHTDPPKLFSDNKVRRSNVRPVKYVD